MRQKVEIGKVLPVEDDAIFEKLAETSRYLRKNALSPERIVCNTDGSDVVLYFGAVEVLLGNEKYEEASGTGRTDPGRTEKEVS